MLIYLQQTLLFSGVDTECIAEPSQPEIKLQASLPAAVPRFELMVKLFAPLNHLLGYLQAPCEYNAVPFMLLIDLQASPETLDLSRLLNHPCHILSYNYPCCPQISGYY